MHVAVAGMAEEDDGQTTPRRRISQEVQVFSKTFHRHASVLDHLHRPLRHRQPGEDRTRGMAQCPDRRLVARRRAVAPRGRPRRRPRSLTRGDSVPRVPPPNPPRTRAAAPRRRRAPPRPARWSRSAPRRGSCGRAARKPMDRSPMSAAITSAIRSRSGISTCSAERNAGIGSSRHVTSVTTPSVPSAPMKRSSRSPESSQASSA